MVLGVILAGLGIGATAISGARAAAEIPQIWQDGRDGKPIRSNNQQVEFQNHTHTDIVDAGRNTEVLAREDVAIAPGCDQRLTLGDMTQTIQVIQNNQIIAKLSANQVYMAMFDNLSELQLSTHQLYITVLHNQQMFFWCTTIVISCLAYRLGSLETEKAYLTAMLLSVPAGQHIGQFIGIELDTKPSSWNPVLSQDFNSVLSPQISSILATWGNLALAFLFTAFQLLNLWNMLNDTAYQKSSPKDALYMVLLCSPFRIYHLLVWRAEPTFRIFCACILDCVFLFCHISHRIQKLVGHTEEVICLTFSPDGTKIASGSADRSVMIWETRTRKQLYKLKSHIDQVISVRFGPDGQDVRTFSTHGAIKVWDVLNGELLQNVESYNSLNIFIGAHSRDGTRIAMSSCDSIGWRTQIRDATTGI
jgi:hypothetical protein